MKSLLENRWIRLTSSLVAVCFLSVQLAAWFPAPALADASDDLKKIEYKYYFRGDYDKAIDALKAFLERDDLSGAQVVEAREYLAASLILSGATPAGKEQFLLLLNQDASYAGPDPAVFKPAIVSAFDDAKADYASNVIRNVPDSAMPDGGGDVAATADSKGKPIYKKWWFYVTMVGVVLIIAAAAGGSSDDGDSRPNDTGTVSIDVGVQ